MGWLAPPGRASLLATTADSLEPEWLLREHSPAAQTRAAIRFEQDSWAYGDWACQA
jgi:hypothetical protein